KEKGNTRSLALSANVTHPLGPHRPSSCSTLSSNNDPADSLQVQWSQMLQERLNRKKSNLSWGRSQMSDARHTMFYVFDTNTPPNVWLLGGKMEFGFQQLGHPLGTFGQNLECMPGRRLHHPADSDNVVVWNLLVEEVTH